MERRLIDANALAKWLDKEHHVDKPTGKCDERQNRVLGIAVSALKNPQIAPTIDAVEVVRCAQCVDYRLDPVKHCALSGMQKEEDDYCSYGERREPDGE